MKTKERKVGLELPPYMKGERLFRAYLRSTDSGENMLGVFDSSDGRVNYHVSNGTESSVHQASLRKNLGEKEVSLAVISIDIDPVRILKVPLGSYELEIRAGGAEDGKLIVKSEGAGVYVSAAQFLSQRRLDDDKILTLYRKIFPDGK